MATTFRLAALLLARRVPCGESGGYLGRVQQSRSSHLLRLEKASDGPIVRPAIVQWLDIHGAHGIAALVPVPGLLYSIGLASMAWLFLRRSRAVGLDSDVAAQSAAIAIFFALMGAYVWWFATESFFEHVSFSRLIGAEGGTSWGLYVGAFIASLVYFRSRGVPALPYLDVAASCGGLGICIGRLACFLAGDDVGVPTNGFWGVAFPQGSAVYNTQLWHGLIQSTTQQSLPVHPIPLYLAVAGLGVFVLTSVVWRSQAFRPGVVLALFFIGDGATRAAIETVRDPSSSAILANWSVAEICAAGLCLVGAILLWHSRRGRRSLA